MLRRSHSQLPIALLILVASALIVVPAVLAQGEVCEEFTEKKQRIGRLGGAQAFSKTPANSPGELLEQLQANKDVIETLLTERGLGHLTDDLISAVESGRGLSERPLERGEVFEWMAWRKRSGPTTSGPLCLVAKKTYQAYEIEVEEQTGTKAAKAMCSLAASGTRVGEKMSVSAAGSSPGVKVTMIDPSGKKTPISGTAWEGEAQVPGDYRFTAEATAHSSGHPGFGCRTSVHARSTVSSASTVISSERAGMRTGCTLPGGNPLT